MRLASKENIKFLEHQQFRWFRLRKRIYQMLRFRPDEPKDVLLIVGCQRSGTSMLHHLFRKDWNTVTYDEISPLSDKDQTEGLRLNSLPEVIAKINSDRAPFVVSKPLVESQNLATLLDSFESGRAIWMYRHYLDVASSNLKFFSLDNGLKDLQPILTGDQSNWRAEHLSAEVISNICDLYSSDMEQYDAAALFWYARNSLFFSRGYDTDNRIKLCCYDDLVTRPESIMKAAYKFVGRNFPGSRIVTDVFSSSAGKGQKIQLSDPVLSLCSDLLARLEVLPRLDSK